MRGPAAYLIGGAGEKWGLLRPSRVRSTPSLFAYNCCRLLQLLFLLLFAFVLHFCFYCCLLHWLSDFAFILPYLTSSSSPFPPLRNLKLFTCQIKTKRTFIAFLSASFDCTHVSSGLVSLIVCFVYSIHNDISFVFFAYQYFTVCVEYSFLLVLFFFFPQKTLILRINKISFA